MTDITKCSGVRKGENCPMRMNCYRFTAPDGGARQSWLIVAPWVHKGGYEPACVMLWRKPR